MNNLKKAVYLALATGITGCGSRTTLETGTIDSPKIESPADAEIAETSDAAHDSINDILDSQADAAADITNDAAADSPADAPSDALSDIQTDTLADSPADAIAECNDANNNCQPYLTEMYVSPRFLNPKKEQDAVVTLIFKTAPEIAEVSLYDSSFNKIYDMGAQYCQSDCSGPYATKYNALAYSSTFPGAGEFFIKYTGKVSGQTVEEQFYNIHAGPDYETYCPEDGVLCLNQVHAFTQPLQPDGTSDIECLTLYAINKTGEEIRLKLADIGFMLSGYNSPKAVDQSGKSYIKNLRLEVHSDQETITIPLTDSNPTEKPGDQYYNVDSIDQVYFPTSSTPLFYSLKFDLNPGTGEIAPSCSIRSQADQVFTASQAQFPSEKIQVTPGDNYEGHKSAVTEIYLSR